MTTSRLLKFFAILSLLSTVTALWLWYATGEPPTRWLIRLSVASFFAALVTSLIDVDTRPRLMLRFLAALFALFALISLAGRYLTSGDRGRKLCRDITDAAPAGSGPVVCCGAREIDKPVHRSLGLGPAADVDPRIACVFNLSDARHRGRHCRTAAPPRPDIRQRLLKLAIVIFSLLRRSCAYKGAAPGYALRPLPLAEHPGLQLPLPMPPSPPQPWPGPVELLLPSSTLLAVFSRGRDRPAEQPGNAFGSSESMIGGLGGFELAPIGGGGGGDFAGITRASH